MKLSQIAEKIHTGQIISRVEAKEEIGDPVLEIRKVLVPRAISNGRVNPDDLGEVKLKKLVDEDRITQSGDIVLKLSTPYDAAYIEGGEDTGLVVPSFCLIVRGIDVRKANPKFIISYINTGYVRSILKSKVSSISIPVLKLGDVKELDIPSVGIERQELIARAYELSCQKQRLLKEMKDNEKTIMESLVINAVRESV